MEVEFLTLDDAVRAIAILQVGPIRDIGLLDSALSRPRASAFGEDAYPQLGGKVSALLHSLTNNHCLVDGNKRLAWLATTIFCDLNALEPHVTDDEAFNLVWDIASGDVSLAEIERRLNLKSVQKSN